MGATTVATTLLARDRTHGRSACCTPCLARTFPASTADPTVQGFSSILVKAGLNRTPSLVDSVNGGIEMGNYEQKSRIRYVTNDYIPGTDVLAVDRKEGDWVVTPAPKQSMPEVVRDVTLVSVTSENPATDRIGWALDPPTAPPA